MAIGKLVLRVFNLFNNREAGPVTHGPFERNLLRVWPHRHIAEWPPNAMNLDGYREFARTIPGVWIATASTK